jgi:hypothetical protein
MVDQFTFQRAEEGLQRCIVIPSAGAIHAHVDTMVLQQGLIGTIRVLAALVGVVDEASRWLTFPKGHLQSSDGQP